MEKSACEAVVQDSDGVLELAVVNTHDDCQLIGALCDCPDVYAFLAQCIEDLARDSRAEDHLSSDSRHKCNVVLDLDIIRRALEMCSA